MIKKFKNGKKTTGRTKIFKSSRKLVPPIYYNKHR